MKKKMFVSLLLFFFMALIITGCNDEKYDSLDEVIKHESSLGKKTIKCTLSKNDSANNYNLNSSYKVHSENGIVNYVETVEKITSTDSSVLKQFENNLNNLYSNMNSEYGGYTYNIVNNNIEVIATTKIDYTTFDVAKLISDDPSAKYMINSDNKITLDCILQTYKQLGAVCE